MSKLSFETCFYTMTESDWEEIPPEEYEEKIGDSHAMLADAEIEAVG